MDKNIQGYLGSLRIGEVQQFKNLTMVPVVSDYDDGLGYITLGEALAVKSIEIREVSEGGSVPELRVVTIPVPVIRNTSVGKSVSRNRKSIKLSSDRFILEVRVLPSNTDDPMRTIPI